MQRVAIGRALVRQPNIYLMDEPLSSLDAKLRAELRLELKHIQRDLGATMLYVTHDQIEAMTMADRIGILDAGPPGPDRHAARDSTRIPANLHVAARLGTAGHQPAPGRSVARRRAAVGAHRRRAHRAPADRAAADGNGRIDWVEHLGDQNHLHIWSSGHKLVALADPYVDMRPGDTVAGWPEPSALFRRDRRAADLKQREAAMAKHFINAREAIVTEALDGLVALSARPARAARRLSRDQGRAARRLGPVARRRGLRRWRRARAEPRRFRRARHADRRRLGRDLRLAERRGAFWPASAR